MKTKSIFIAYIASSIFALSNALAVGEPVNNWDFKIQNATGSSVIFEGITGKCDILVQNTTFSPSTTENAFTSSIKGADSSCNSVITYSGTNSVCEITVKATAKYVNDTTTKYNATASYQGTCTGPTNLGSSGSYTVIIK